ncbi:MAG TPA: GNAT family N-acetyltransferase [Solirubrobacteraceae bacterium]|nr:GNAT family N-acetyltransferase [Solirubrobacteraceae bacterium]
MGAAADQFQIQRLTAAHRAGWQPLWEAYLRFYRGEVGEAVTGATFARLCDPEGAMAGLVAISPDGGVAGLAHLVFHPTTWEITSMCYLEDLFVVREARGAGVAKRLLDAVYELAAARGAVRVYWHTQQFNAPARSLYDTVAQLQSWVVYEHEL